MRTLDEVIKAWSICFSDNSRSNCTGCPYADEDGESACFNHDREDALHYLKEYKIKRERIMAKAQDCEDAEKHLQDEIARYQETVKEYEEILTDYVALKQYWAEQQENNPLTWDELKTMEGKPVWVEADYFEKGWFLVDASLVDIWVTGYDCAEHQLREENIGVSWQAYRKERE